MNVTNKNPTICINDLLQQLSDDDAEPFSVEELIARSVSTLEQLIDTFETPDWRHVLDQYYTYWLHRHVTACHATTLHASVHG